LIFQRAAFRIVTSSSVTVPFAPSHTIIVAIPVTDAMLVSRAPFLVINLCLLGKLARTEKAKTHVPNICLPAPCPSEAPQTYLSVTNAIIPASIDKVWEYAGGFYDLYWISKNIFPFLDSSTSHI
jgi:hypothetical protein